jgi:hypothetical protein
MPLVPGEPLRYLTGTTTKYLLPSIDSVFDLKAGSLLKQVSQFEPAASKYRPDWAPDTFKETKEELKLMQHRKDGHPVEAFRYLHSRTGRLSRNIQQTGPKHSTRPPTSNPL